VREATGWLLMIGNEKKSSFASGSGMLAAFKSRGV